MTKRISYLLLAAFLVLGNSCDDKKEYLITIETKYGDMKAVLYDETPLHKENFIALAEAGEYDSTIFHRVMKGFMVQGGGVDMKNGTTTDRKIKAEFVPKYHHKKGAIAAARQPDQINPEKASSYCQFYVVQGEKWTREQLAIDQNKLRTYMTQFVQLEKNAALLEELQALYQSGDSKGYQDKINSLIPQVEQEFNVSLKKDYSEERLKDYETIGGAPHLDDDYTVFGEVIDGIEVVDSIANQRVVVQQQHKPVEDIYMKITVEHMSKKKITKEYGYQFDEEK